MEKLLNKSSEKKELGQNEIIFVDVNSNFHEIKKRVTQNDDILVISFDYNSHIKLKDEAIDHKISDEYINDNECKKIQNHVYRFTYWYNEKEFSDLLMFKGVNIGRLYQDELLNFFVRFLKRFKEIKNIFYLNQGVTFLADNELFRIINFFTSSCVNIYNSEEKIHNFTHDEIKIGLKIGKNEKVIFLNEKKYLRFKNYLDKLVTNFFKPKPIKDDKKNILFVEYNTDRFEELFLKSKEYKSQVFFYGRKRPPFWNFSTLKTIINSKCKIITESYISDHIFEANFLKANQIMEKQINELLKKYSIFEEFFIFEEEKIFELIKPTLVELIQNRLTNTLKEIELIHRMFEKIQIDYSIVINEIGFYEQIISALSKKFNVKCIHMQEGFHWDSKEVYQRLISAGVYLHDAEKLLVWGDIDKKLAIENAHVASEKIEIIGAPRYDKLFGTGKIDGDYILLASSADPQPEEVEGLRIPKIENYLFDIIETCKIVSELKEKLVIKLHPSPTQLTNLEKHTNKINSNIQVFSSGEIIDLLPKAKILICIGVSTTMIEAVILKKPVIFIPGIDYNYKNPTIITANGCIKSDIKNLKTDILKMLKNVEYSKGIMQGSENYLSELIHFQGKSSDRFYKFLEKND